MSASACGSRRSTRRSGASRGDGAPVVVADVFVGELFVNEALVRGGDAWAYPRYVRHPQILAAQDEARRHLRGLWRLPAAEREAPWEWRRAHRQGPRGRGPREREAARPDADT